MIHSIVVPVDGSDVSEQALPIALRVGSSMGATAHITHVFVPRADIPLIYDELDYDATPNGQLEEEAREYLRAIRRKYCDSANAAVTFDLVKARPVTGLRGDTGVVVTALRRHASKRRADLIILSSHGVGGINRAWLGSVADRLLRRSRVPVFLVRATDRPPDPDLQHVLIPLDGSPLAEQIAPLALELAVLSGARVTLLRVIIPRQSIARPAPVARVDLTDFVSQREQAASYLDSALTDLAVKPRSREAVIIADTNPARAIITFAESQGVDLIALTTHGRGGFNRLMMGSVADKVLRGAPTNVLIQRPRA